MQAQAVDSKQLIEEYFQTLCSQPKTEDLMDRYISDPKLKQHIREAEAAFPGYTIDRDKLVAEGDTVAVRGTMHGTHRGAFAGIPPTGREVTAGVMLFYRIADGRIAEHWMQLDTMSLMAQLTS